MNEIIFNVEETIDGGYTARAVGESIFTEGDDLDGLRANIRDAVNCHFEPDKKPEFLQLRIANYDLTEEQLAEIKRRMEDYRKNPDDSIPWEEVRESMYKKTGSRPKN